MALGVVTGCLGGGENGAVVTGMIIVRLRGGVAGVAVVGGGLGGM